MKPSFALTLSHESIGLLHRTPNGWLPIGAVATDDPDLPGALDYLRRTALGLEPQGFATKLVIPNSEILYDTVRAPGPKPAQRRAQIAAAIEGRTPYTLDELAFDWSGTGEDVQVAVVARETLAEAEAFATEHRFNPVSFVAMPDPGGFAAEPWFGQTACAPDLLAPGEKVVRDQDPIRVVQRPPARPAKTPVAAAPEPEPEQPPAAPESTPVTLADPAPAPTDIVAQGEAPAGYDAGTEVGLSAAAEPALGTGIAADPEPRAAEAANDPAPSVPSDPTPDLVPTEPPAPGPSLPLAPEPPVELPASEPEQEPAPAPVGATGPLTAPAEDPSPLTATGPVSAPAEAPVATPARWVTAQAERGAADPALTAALDDADLTLAWPGEDEAQVLAQTKAALGASLAPPPVAADVRMRADPISDLPPPVSAPVQRALAAARAGRDPAAPRPPEPVGQSLTEKMQKAISKTAKAGKGKPKPPAPRPSFAPPPPPLPPSATQPQVPPAKSEAEKMTVFGERRSPVNGKPRFLGLLLTAVLLLVLAAIAVWAAMFLDPQQSSSKPAPQAVATATPPDPAPAEQPDDVAATIAPVPVAPPAPDSETAAGPEAEPTPAAEVTTAVVTAPEPAPVVAADVGADAAAPPAAATAGLGAEGALPQADDALAVPQRVELARVPPGRADPAPAPPGALPAFGALFQFDAQGNILPTPEGVITPDGVRLVAGRPERVPPPRPSAIQPEQEPAPEVVAQPAPAEPAPPPPGAIAILPQPTTAAPQDTGFQPDSASPRRRPPQRPAALATPASPAAVPAAPVADEGALPALSPTSITSRRPPSRPTSILAAGENDRARAVAAAAAAAAASASTALAADTPGLAPTRRPPARPGELARAAVAAAVGATVAPPSVAVERTRIARAAPAPDPVAAAPTERNAARFGAHPDDAFDDGEPEVVSAAANAPTRATVARQATVTGALNLGRTNLIGVFGTSNARYALVRESGGRLVRVKVGDRVDGGRVVAIGATELSYQRSGETVRLTMPRG